jgi:hypothetical protein
MVALPCPLPLPFKNRPYTGAAHHVTLHATHDMSRVLSLRRESERVRDMALGSRRGER